MAHSSAERPAWVSARRVNAATQERSSVPLCPAHQRAARTEPSARGLKRRVASRLRGPAWLLLACAALVGTAGCSDDDDATAQVSAPGTAADAGASQEEQVDAGLREDVDADSAESADAGSAAFGDAGSLEGGAQGPDAASAAQDASAPDVALFAPTITEPRLDGQLVSPADVHMEIAPFAAADPALQHLCTDWEIWSASPAERVWVTSCIGGLERVHTHLGDGVFEGSLAGARALLPGTDYHLRVRWRVGAGAEDLGFGPYAERPFHTRTPEPPRPGAPEWLVTQEGFVVEELVSGFQLPVNIAFTSSPLRSAADPLFYVVELYGNIKVVTSDLQVLDYATGLLNFDPTGNFPGSGEQGLVGIAIEPATSDLFVSMLYDESGAHHPKVVRLHSTEDGLSMLGQTTVLDMKGELQGQSHQISSLTLGPDGKLYVQMGDGLEVATARDLSSFRGKVLRVNLDGTAPQDNPFYDESDGIDARDYVFAYGFRNPFGGAWTLAEPALYTVENGPDMDRFARVIAGSDYGWDGTNESMQTRALYNWPVAVAPVNVAFVQPEAFHGSGFPEDKFGHAFVTESGPTYAPGPQGKRVSEFSFQPDGQVTGPPVSLVEYQGAGVSSVAALAAGPDGLYFSELYRSDGEGGPSSRGASIYRIRYVGAEP